MSSAPVTIPQTAHNSGVAEDEEDGGQQELVRAYQYAPVAKVVVRKKPTETGTDVARPVAGFDDSNATGLDDPSALAAQYEAARCRIFSGDADAEPSQQNGDAPAEEGDASQSQSVSRGAQPARRPKPNLRGLMANDDEYRRNTGPYGRQPNYHQPPRQMTPTGGVGTVGGVHIPWPVSGPPQHQPLAMPMMGPPHPQQAMGSQWQPSPGGNYRGGMHSSGTHALPFPSAGGAAHHGHLSHSRTAQNYPSNFHHQSFDPNAAQMLPPNKAQSPLPQSAPHESVLPTPGVLTSSPHFMPESPVSVQVGVAKNPVGAFPPSLHHKAHVGVVGPSSFGSMQPSFGPRFSPEGMPPMDMHSFSHQHHMMLQNTNFQQMAPHRDVRNSRGSGPAPMKQRGPSEWSPNTETGPMPTFPRSAPFVPSHHQHHHQHQHHYPHYGNQHRVEPHVLTTDAPPFVPQRLQQPLQPRHSPQVPPPQRQTSAPPQQPTLHHHHVHHHVQHHVQHHVHAHHHNQDAQPAPAVPSTHSVQANGDISASDEVQAPIVTEGATTGSPATAVSDGSAPVRRTIAITRGFSGKPGRGGGATGSVS